MPPDEQIVMVAFLSHFPWEDLDGLPAQIMMQGSKKKLMEAQRAGRRSRSNAAIRRRAVLTRMRLGEILIQQAPDHSARIWIARSNCSASAAISSARSWSISASSPRATCLRALSEQLQVPLLVDRRAARRFARNRNALAQVPAPVPLPAGGAARSHGHARDGRSAGFRNALDGGSPAPG